MSEQQRPPEPNEIEVSILGGGKGYGESIVVHLGQDHWLIVDSTQHPETKKALPLEYLSSIGVNYVERIRWILASHWHDDHVKGISKIYEACPNARFICSQALEKKQFLILLQKSSLSGAKLGSGMEEFRSIFQQIQENSSPLVRAIQDRTLINLTEGDIEVYSLSPSDAAIAAFEESLAELITNTGINTSISSTMGPNHTSVVTVIKAGDDVICLGGDLENASDTNMGWQAVVNAAKMPTGQISIFKIPHHGSQNAHHNGFWDQAFLADREPLLGLTPYNRGRNFLPSQDDIARISSYSLAVFSTSFPKSSTKKRLPQEKKMINDLGYEVSEIPFHYGHIRLRKTIGSSNPWNIELFGTALNLIPTPPGE